MDRVDGPNRIHETMEAVMKAEKSCAAAATWFWPVGSGLASEKDRSRFRYDRLNILKGELREIRQELAKLAGEAYQDVSP